MAHSRPRAGTATAARACCGLWLTAPPLQRLSTTAVKVTATAVPTVADVRRMVVALPLTGHRRCGCVCRVLSCAAAGSVPSLASLRRSSARDWRNRILRFFLFFYSEYFFCLVGLPRVLILIIYAYRYAAPSSLSQSSLLHITSKMFEIRVGEETNGIP